MTELDRINGEIDKLFYQGRLNSQGHLDLEAVRARLWREANAEPVTTEKAKFQPAPWGAPASLI